jgi:hypothetical protein
MKATRLTTAPSLGELGIATSTLQIYSGVMLLVSMGYRCQPWAHVRFNPGPLVLLLFTINLGTIIVNIERNLFVVLAEN